MNYVAPKNHVWLTFLLNVSKSDVLHSHFHNQRRTIPRIRPPLIFFNSWIFHATCRRRTHCMDCFWTSNQFHHLPRPTQNLITVTAQLSVTCWRHHFLTLLVKTLATLDVKKQQSSNFTEMTSGRYSGVAYVIPWPLFVNHDCYIPTCLSWSLGFKSDSCEFFLSTFKVKVTGHRSKVSALDYNGPMIMSWFIVSIV